MRQAVEYFPRSIGIASHTLHGFVVFHVCDSRSTSQFPRESGHPESVLDILQRIRALTREETQPREHQDEILQRWDHQTAAPLGLEEWGVSSGAGVNSRVFVTAETLPSLQMGT